MEQERKQEMKIWKERFNPSKIEPFKPMLDEFNKAWEWIFEKDESGEYVRAGLCLIVIREHSLRLHRIGVKNSAVVASIAVWRLYSANAIKMPQRMI
jgi:hypothetical protein